MAEHHTLTVSGYKVDFHIYVTVPDAVVKVKQLEPYFRRMPPQHLAILYPIFVMNRKPGGREGGGTWPPHLVRDEVMGTRRSRNTGIPDAEVQQWVVTPGRGMIGLSKDRWERPLERLKFTVFHEVGHCIDIALGLVPHGAREADFAGMETTRCGAGGLMTRRVVEAYARYICSPHAIYHSLPPGQTGAQANQRLIAALRRSRAFGTVPASWEPLYAP